MRLSPNRTIFGPMTSTVSTKRLTKAFRPVIHRRGRRYDRARQANATESPEVADVLGEAPCLLYTVPRQRRLAVNKRRKQRATWMLVDAGSAMAAGAAMSGLIEGGWRTLRNEEPPIDPDSSTTSWGKAVAWTALTGVLVSVAQMAARRGAAAGWKHVTGRRPPRHRVVAKAR